MVPNSGLIQLADECFRKVDALPIDPAWHPPTFEEILLGIDGDQDKGWFYCVERHTFLQVDPFSLVPENVMQGRHGCKGAMLS